MAQQQAAAPAAAQTLDKAQLDQLVAPIALYPDPLLAQVLMASTYPLEVVEAARWADGHKGLSGDPLTQALASEPWDESVKALIATPTALTMMSQKLDWTQALGNAVVAQQPDVMAAVQRLRQKAEAHGTLKTSKEQTVTVNSAGPAPVVEIIPAEPEVIYVPYYDPAVVYGPWAYPAYPPYFFPAPYGYVAGPGLWFGAGIALGFGWYHWGNVGRFDWNHGNIYVHGNVDAHWHVDGNHVNVNVTNRNNNNNNNNDNSHNNNNDNDHANDDASKQDDDHAADRADENYGRGDDDRGGDMGGGFDRGGGGFGRGGGGGGRR